ncbi:kinase-like domain-containing protein [Spinellus fusiger]|nr:kinase-like domain-containing protein [Spinellus fusiger]
MNKSPIIKRILELFKRTHETNDEPAYPPALEQAYTITSKTLGVGSFAVVKECVHRASGQSFALKIILKKSVLDILKQVRHPHIVSMHEMYESKDAIVHRDIKPENLLFKTQEEDANLMITDFGLSKILTSQDAILMTACGTPGYVAPEVLLQTGHGKPVDLWSVGVIAFTLLSGYTPFWGEDQTSLFESIMSGKYEYDDEYWKEISDNAKSFIDGVLEFSPEKRLTAEKALNHPWIVENQGHDTCDQLDIAATVRRGLSHRRTFRSIATAITIAQRFKQLDIEFSDDDEF